MDYIFTKKFDGTFTMSWIGIPISTDEISTQVRDIKTFNITPTKGIKSITNITDIIRGENENHYFKKYFSFSNDRSGVTYSEMTNIDEMKQDYCPSNDLYLSLSYFRIDTDDKTTPTLSINTIVIEGTYDIEETDEIIDVPNTDEEYILSPKNIYKVFKLTGFEIYGVNTDNLIIRYRFTQDGGRTYTTWEPLSTENISTVKLNSVRFAEVQYSIIKIDKTITSKVFDIILLGDFQNINNYYLKTNRYGIREDCYEKYQQWSGGTDAQNGVSASGDTSNSGKNPCLGDRTSFKGDGNNLYNYNKDWFTQGISCYLTGNVIANLNASNNTSQSAVGESQSSGNFDPYASGKKIGDWYSYLAGSLGKTFGWTVDYHLTDPDGNGIDKYVHEYQLFNIVDVQKIKIIVPENNFPDNQVQMNEFMLDMMETFQIIILKDEFHKAFGIDKRPSQKDIIFLCQANRFYRVKHAQVHREIMYMGIYYNVVLEKYEKLANEQNLSSASRNIIEPLTKNNTIDSLFGFDNKQEENKIVNKQLKPITHNVYRANVNPKLSIIKKDIFNGLKGTKIADSYYNLSSLIPGTSAVTYTYQDSYLDVNENRAITLWMNFNNKYDPSKSITEEVFESYNIKNTTYYEFLNNYDLENEKGYKLWYSNKEIVFTINDLHYTLQVPDITTNIWYGIIVNMDNRQRKISLDVYKRNYDYNITFFNDNYEQVVINSKEVEEINNKKSNGYRAVKNTEINSILKNTSLSNLVHIDYENVPLNSFEVDNIITIKASDIKLTSIRIYSDIAQGISKSNILLQNVVQDSDFLLMADNANKKIYTSNIKNTRWE